jgi:hypothetical protein
VSYYWTPKGRGPDGRERLGESVMRIPSAGENPMSRARGLRTGSRHIGRRGSVWKSCAIAVLLTLAGLASTSSAEARDPAGDEVILLGGLGGDAMASWRLGADQPFLAVPYLGPDLAEAVAIVKLGAGVGVALFEQPFFQSADETCEYSLGIPGEPDLWWRSQGTHLLPTDGATGPLEAVLGVRPFASMILYDRTLGPPPGALLLEERRYVNWSCEKPTKARAYNRLFIPVPQAPHRLGCFNLSTALESESYGRISLDFLATGVMVLLLPRDSGDSYEGLEHRVAATLFDQMDCAGKSVAVAYPESGGRRFALKDYGFSRRARSLMVSYEGGAYDPFLPPPGQRPETPATEIVQARPAAQTTSASAAAPESGTYAAEPSSSVEMPASLTQSLAEQESGVPDAPAVSAQDSGTDTQSTAQSTAQTTAPSTAQSTAQSTAPSTAPSSIEASAEASAPASAAPAPAASEPAAPDPETVQTGLLISPEAPQAPVAPSGSQTFEFPLLQGYRLHACLSGDRDCGDPAASEWCRGLGFSSAANWTIDENIGSLYPTLAIGDLGLCANFVCDGFREITCAP